MERPYSLAEIIEIISRSIAEMESKAEKQLPDISLQQLYYLDTIARMGNPTPTALAEALHLSKPSVTAILNRFVQQGYLCKKPSDKDRRSFHIHLTEKGQRIAIVHDTIHQNIAQHFVDNLEEAELQQLVKLLNKVVRTALA